MLVLNLGTHEHYDGIENKFTYKKGGIVRFEYSLKMIYDWEETWRKPFLKGDLNDEELLDFYRRMALDPMDEEFMTDDLMEKLADYIGDPRTATKFHTPKGSQNGSKTPSNGKVYTAEELYAIMCSANIPLEFENRNLNRLFTILKIIGNQNEEPKKMDRTDIYRQNAELNRLRKEQMNSKG